jgi:hypothetical protein
VPTLPISVGSGEPWLDIGSFARPGPGRRDRLSSAHTAAIARTVCCTPEVMIKMLNQGGRDVGSVGERQSAIPESG